MQGEGGAALTRPLPLTPPSGSDRQRKPEPGSQSLVSPELWGSAGTTRPPFVNKNGEMLQAGAARLHQPTGPSLAMRSLSHAVWPMEPQSGDAAARRIKMIQLSMFCFICFLVFPVSGCEIQLPGTHQDKESKWSKAAELGQGCGASERDPSSS